jgi:hypothetical protein
VEIDIMTAVELGKGPSDGFNSATASTDLSSSDQTRTLGAFNTTEAATALLGHADRGVGVVAEGGGGRPAVIATSEGGSAAFLIGRVGVMGDLHVTGILQNRELESRLESLVKRVSQVAARVFARDIENAVKEDLNTYVTSTNPPADPFFDIPGVVALLGHDL